MNSENSKTSERHRLLLNLTDKINLRRKDKYIALSNLSISYTWKNIKKSYKNNKFKISAPTWNEEFEFTDQNSKPLEIQNKINVTLVINQSISYKNDTLFSLTNRSNICERLSSKYSKKILDHAKQSAGDALETASERAIQKTA